MSIQMPELTRTVRSQISLVHRQSDMAAPRHNTFAAWPSTSALSVYCQLQVTVTGRPDPQTGYLLSITEIDRAVREAALPLVTQAIQQEPGTDPGRLLKRMLQAVQERLTVEVSRLQWNLTPYYHLSLKAAHMDRVYLSQQFDFAAAHRLHCDTLSEEANRAQFGKCNNPNGHGHNYRIEVVVATPLESPDQRPRLALPALERIVDEVVISRFDHTHLNVDTVEFASTIPSVEHISRVCFELLREPLAAAGGDLDAVTVWETEKTACTWRASELAPPHST
jgi:6-pyruvoyltetrahydropterin/6-carboxytetrahydropterin synthase